MCFSRRFIFLLAAAFALSLSATMDLHAAGFAHNENFVVFTPAEPTQEEGQRFAEAVLAQADAYRAQISRDLFGEELPPSVGRTVINVSFSDTEDSGLTWAKEPPRRYSNVYLKTNPDRALGSTLAHEVVHVVLSTQYPHPNRLPAWVEEGLASRYDDQERKATRERIIAWYVRTGNWPEVRLTLQQSKIVTDDQVGYTVASSVVDYLLTRGDTNKLFAFAQEGVAKGWDAALKQQYGFSDVDSLQAAWQAWIKQQHGQAAVAPVGLSQP